MSRKGLFVFILFGLGLLVLGFFIYRKMINVTPESKIDVIASSTKESATTTSPLNASTTNFNGILNTLPGSPDAPQQVQVDSSQVPVGSVRLEISDRGFNPSEFTVLAGQPVSLAISAVGANTHVFIFPDSSLMGLTMMISGGETKVLNFTAPEAGNYNFRDDIPTFRQNTGVMLVK